MNQKILNALLIVFSMIAYLEWGKNNSMFLIEGEVEVMQKLFSDPLSVLHPFTIIPLLGQVLLIITLFQKTPGKKITYTGLICISLLLVLVFTIGLITLNYKTILSTLPFLIFAILTIRALRKTGIV